MEKLKISNIKKPFGIVIRDIDLESCKSRNEVVLEGKG